MKVLFKLFTVALLFSALRAAADGAVSSAGEISQQVVPPQAKKTVSIDDFTGHWALKQAGCVEPHNDIAEAGSAYEVWNIVDGKFEHDLDASDNGQYPDCKKVFSKGEISGTASGQKLILHVKTTVTRDCNRNFDNTDLTVLSDGAHGESLGETFQLETRGEETRLIDDVSVDYEGCTRYRKIFIVQPEG